jgi:hypothetical protein
LKSLPRLYFTPSHFLPNPNSSLVSRFSPLPKGGRLLRRTVWSTAVTDHDTGCLHQASQAPKPGRGRSVYCNPITKESSAIAFLLQCGSDGKK